MSIVIEQSVREVSRTVGKIPVRNLWFLYLYASDLARFQGRFNAEIEASPDFPELIARLLCHSVELRLRRNLSRAYRSREAVLSRVRGKMDVLTTTTHQLLAQGKIACRFEELSIDTPRNRLVRAALDILAPMLSSRELAHRCRKLAGDLAGMGVSRVRPTRSDIKADRIGRNDAEDALMVSLATIVFDLVLPTEQEGDTTLTSVNREERIVRHLFEKAMGNFLAAELSPDSRWRVIRGQRMGWSIEKQTPGIAAILPGMKTDIVLENNSFPRRIVIDTKFTDILTKNAYQGEILKSGYIYQMYSYLRSQENPSAPITLTTEGLFLHPTIDCDLDETVRLQGHNIRFLTIDLSFPTFEIIERLRTSVVEVVMGIGPDATPDCCSVS